MRVPCVLFGTSLLAASSGRRRVITMESARVFVLLLLTILLSAAGPCAAASPPAPHTVMCDSFTIATQLIKNCTSMDDAPDGICCEAAVTAVHMSNCLCAVINQPHFLLSNLSGEDVVSIYTTCRGSPPPFDAMKGCSESDESPPVGPSPPPPALMPPAAPAPPPPTPCNCPMVPSPASHFRWVTKLRDGFIMAACTIGGWLFLIGLVRVCTMIRPHLPSWFPGALLDAMIDDLSDTARARLDMLHPSLRREILRLADWAKEHSAEDSTPALIIQVTELVQVIHLHLGMGKDPEAGSSRAPPSSLADFLAEIASLCEILRREKPVRR